MREKAYVRKSTLPPFHATGKKLLYPTRYRGSGICGGAASHLACNLLCLCRIKAEQRALTLPSATARNLGFVEQFHLHPADGQTAEVRSAPRCTTQLVRHEQGVRRVKDQVYPSGVFAPPLHSAFNVQFIYRCIRHRQQARTRQRPTGP